VKLLIITQVVDTQHPILGFFHRWIEEFATQVESVEVIALYVGTHALPANVRVHSLGKEEGENRLKYLWRFYKYSWQLRHEYDVVFVHMNQVYPILGAVLWRLLRKKIYLWYAHGTVSTTLRLAVALVNTVFTSTLQGLQVDTTKRVVVGQGIDMEQFTYVERIPNLVPQFIVDGRIARSKNIDVLLTACANVRDSGQNFVFHIVGIPLTLAEKEYAAELILLVETLRLTDLVVWHGGVSQKELMPLLQAADIYIHDGATQSLDKVLVQAVATGLPTISSNTAFSVIVEPVVPTLLFPAHDAESLAKRIIAIIKLSGADRVALMNPLCQNFRTSYSIEQLISGIVQRL